MMLHGFVGLIVCTAGIGQPLSLLQTWQVGEFVIPQGCVVMVRRDIIRVDYHRICLSHITYPHLPE